MHPFWHPSRFEKTRPALESRARILAAIRGYFMGLDFVEVDTPALQVSPGLEPHLHPFKTRYRLPHGDSRELYLCTSPEFACKKLLAAGMERIYQMAHVFRNAEGGTRHHPEFMMLEWYRAHAGYAELMADCTGILHAAARAVGANTFSYGELDCDVLATPEILTVAEAFRRFADMELMDCIDRDDDPTSAKIEKEARRIGVRVGAGDRFDDVVLRIMGEKIEPHLGKDQPCFLADYPLCMAALARAKPDNPRLAERFELYVCGLELANGFVELTDAAVQRARFEKDMALKEKLYHECVPLDEDFLAALAHMPPAAGIALGVDRLVMLATGMADIREVLWAPVAGA